MKHFWTTRKQFWHGIIETRRAKCTICGVLKDIIWGFGGDEESGWGVCLDCTKRTIGEGDPTGRYMDADEVSEFTRISKHFIGKLIKARAIPHMEVGKHRVFDRLMITQWLTEHYVPDPRMEISHEDN